MKVELRHIHKTFGKVHANDDISLTIPSGSIQGILGENGAGKSTLMKVFSGFIQLDSGDILLDGKKVTINSPADSIHLGIGMLHQDPLDFPPMKVIDNFIIGQEGGIIPDRKKATKDFLDMSEEYGFHISPDAYVDRLTVGERQQLEILRLLWLGAKVLILDEPTTGISASQKEKLFATLKKLASQDKTAIFVSHKLEEVEGLCSQVAVLQRGKLVGKATPPYETKKLVQMMFGKEVAQSCRENDMLVDVAVKVQNINIEDTRLEIKNVNLDIHRGEVIGLAGMEGSGQRQFLRTLAGIKRPTKGKLLVENIDMTGKSYHEFQRHGISYVPAARLEEGLISGLTLTEHFILAEEQNSFFINNQVAQGVTASRIDQFFIRGTPASKIEALSGGNQQRALLALLRESLNLILLEHPTRGLDIESSIWIWSKLKERCRQCTSIVFISSDLEEVLQYSDRILVFFNGKVSQPLDATTTNVQQLGELIGGKGW
jgi:simple sugar transport system ATP-binding protein